jgi:hypothetical protein
MHKTSELFSLTSERDSCILWFLDKLNLTYRRLTGFAVSFNFSQTSFGFLRLDLIFYYELRDHMMMRFADALGYVSIMSRSYHTSYGFSRSYFNLDCGLHDHIIMRFISRRFYRYFFMLTAWSRDSYHLVSKLDSINQVISLC